MEHGDHLYIFTKSSRTDSLNWASLICIDLFMKKSHSLLFGNILPPALSIFIS